MQVAATIGERSACVNAQIGTVIVNPDNRIVSTGYNGPPAGMASEKALGQSALCEYDCPRAFLTPEQRTASYSNCIAIHAEANALLFADRHDVAGGTMYTTRVPCEGCQKLIANSGLVRIVIRDAGDDHLPAGEAWQFLKRCGIELLVMP